MDKGQNEIKWLSLQFFPQMLQNVINFVSLVPALIGQKFPTVGILCWEYPGKLPWILLEEFLNYPGIILPGHMSLYICLWGIPKTSTGKFWLISIVHAFATFLSPFPGIRVNQMPPPNSPSSRLFVKQSMPKWWCWSPRTTHTILLNCYKNFS